MRPGLHLAMLAVLAGAAAPAWAGQHVYSYDSANPATEAMTEAGLTFVFEKSLLGQRVLKLVETHDIGEADLKPADNRALGAGDSIGALGPGGPAGQLYEITDQADGRALKRALCHADRAWLMIGRLKAGQPLHVKAVAVDGATGRPRLCATLDYAFHGEWALPTALPPQPDRSDPFNDAPANTRY